MIPTAFFEGIIYILLDGQLLKKLSSTLLKTTLEYFEYF